MMQNLPPTQHTNRRHDQASIWLTSLHVFITVRCKSYFRLLWRSVLACVIGITWFLYGEFKVQARASKARVEILVYVFQIVIRDLASHKQQRFD